MPTYTYRCDSCGHQFETVQRFTEDALTECPTCGAAIRRVIQPVGVVFKGSGWYITDSRAPQKDGSESETKTAATAEPGAAKESGAAKDGGAAKESSPAKDAPATAKTSEKPAAKATAS